MKRLVIAFQFLTRLPMPRVTADAGDFAASMRWFPAVGLMIGAAVAGAAYAAAPIDAWTAALAALLVWVGLTGALHLDGLGDLADALGAAHGDRTRLLAVLADPHVGSFGVVSIVLQLLAKLVLLHAAIDAGILWPLILVPLAARIGPLAWTRWLPPLHQGLASRFRAAVRPVDLAGWATVLAGACVAVPALIAAPLAIVWWGWRLRVRLGGVSGDAHGAGIELVETALLATLVLAARLA